jgi:hypothetical protein
MLFNVSLTPLSVDFRGLQYIFLRFLTSLSIIDFRGLQYILTPLSVAIRGLQYILTPPSVVLENFSTF